MKKIKKDETRDVLLNPRKDRRLLSNVPDKEEIRDNIDRRGYQLLDNHKEDPSGFITSKNAGIRYVMKTDVEVVCKSSKGNKKLLVKSIDISTTGLLLELKDETQLNIINNAEEIKLKFKILPGSMPEGYEMKVKIKGEKVRDSITSEGKIICGIEFTETLSEYSSRKKDRYVLVT